MISKGKYHKYKKISLDELPEMLTCAQVGSYMQVCDNTVSKWIREGKLTACRIPGSKTYRVDKSDLVTFLDRCKGCVNR